MVPFRTAELCSRYKPSIPIIAVSRHEQTARQLHLYRAVFPLYYGKGREEVWTTDVDNRINYGINVGKDRGFIHSGDFLVVITGWRQGKFEMSCR